MKAKTKQALPLKQTNKTIQNNNNKKQLALKSKQNKKNENKEK